MTAEPNTLSSNDLCNSYNAVVNEISAVRSDERVQHDLVTAIDTLQKLRSTTQLVKSEREIARMEKEIQRHRSIIGRLRGEEGE